MPSCITSDDIRRAACAAFEADVLMKNAVHGHDHTRWVFAADWLKDFYIANAHLAAKGVSDPEIYHKRYCELYEKRNGSYGKTYNVEKLHYPNLCEFKNIPTTTYYQICLHIHTLRVALGVGIWRRKEEKDLEQNGD